MKNLKLPGRYADGDGLHLNIAPGGSKSWIQRITVEGKRRDLGIDRYPGVSLAEARNLASDNKRAVREGRDPASAKKINRASKKAVPEAPPGVPTFREAAAIVHHLNCARWENVKTRNDWWQRAERYAFPANGNMPIDRIGCTEVLDILTPVWTVKPETARRIRLIIRMVMVWGLAYGHITVNPASEVIDAALPSMPKVKEPFKALPYEEVRAAIDTVDASTSFPGTKLAFKFLVLTAARTGEVRGATRDEIDIDQALWTIPAARMKGGKEHRVPLSTVAMEVLREAQELPTNAPPTYSPTT